MGWYCGSIRFDSIPFDFQVKVYRDAAGPRVLRQLTESVQSGLETGKFPKEAKEANEALIESFKVCYDTWT